VIPVTGTRFTLGYGDFRAPASETVVTAYRETGVTFESTGAVVHSVVFSARRQVTFERVLGAFLLTGLLTGLFVVVPAFPVQAGDTLTAAERATMDRWLSAERAPAPVQDTTDPAAAAPPIAELVGGLEARLAAAPADASGWALLAQTYAWLGRTDDARKAARRAVELGVDAATLDRKLLAAHTERAIAD
jgi:hypothetical protein